VFLERFLFTYAGSVQCGVEIVQTDSRPGTGDHEDPEEIGEDVRGTFYEIRHQSAGGEGRSSSGALGFESVEVAMRHVESVAAGVRWE
jgi:hypothetical protein